MAGRMKRASAFGALAAAALLLFGVDAGAQILNDPTRPPAGIEAPEAAEGAAAGGPVLQSVKISRSGRTAIISGETVELGAKYRESRVIGITENEVVLRSANGTETLRMYPAVEMKPVVAAAPAGAKRAAQKRSPATNTRGKQE